MTADRTRFELSSSAAEQIAALGGSTLGTILGLIETDAQRLVPVATGKLRSRTFTEQDDDTTGRLVADTEYAKHVELGTSKMAAQPFMRPAVMRKRSL